ncbi:MAG: VOC family protein [Hyphomicrobiaceae bacterium]
MAASAITKGAHHIGLTVLSIDETRSFFTNILGFNQVGEMPNYPAVFLSDGTTMITLWQVTNPNTAIPFDRKNVVGLHHFALKVDDATALDQVHSKLNDATGVEVEFGPEPLGDGPTKHMMCFIPGGIRMELIAPAS